MNKMWLRISLTFTAVMILFIFVPLLLVGIFGDPNPEAAGIVENSSGPIAETVVEAREAAQGILIIPLLGAFLRLLLFIALISITASVILSRTLTSPLNRLAIAARNIAKGDLEQQVEIKGSAEIKDVAYAFNEMTAELKTAENLRQNLLADVAHELRTPITVIQGNLRAILDDVYELDKSEIARLYDQIRQLSRMVDDLREIAQAEARQLPLEMTPVDMVSIVNKVADIYLPILETEKIDLLKEKMPESAVVNGDRARLTQCMQNLMNNAIRHTPQDGKIIIRTQVEAEMVRISIQDSGSGIVPDRLNHIFDRFYRTDESRSRSTGGTGLGLAITRALVEAHQGNVYAQSDGEGKGSIFTVELPLMEEDLIIESDQIIE